MIYHERYIIFTHLCDVILEILSNRSEIRISERVVKLGHSVALIFTVQFERLQLANVLVCRSTAFLFVLWTIFLALFTNLCSVGVGVSPQCVLSGISGIQSSREYPSTSYSDMKYTPFGTFCIGNVDGSVHDCSNSIANALELMQSCAKPLISWILVPGIHLPIYIRVAQLSLKHSLDYHNAN